MSQKEEMKQKKKPTDIYTNFSLYRRPWLSTAVNPISILAQPHQCLAARAANEGPQSAPLFQAHLEVGSSVINMFYRDPETVCQRGLAVVL
jgi:hypothetical protein